MHGVDVEVRVERRVAGDVDEGQAVRPGVFGEQPVLKGRQPFHVAIVERIIGDVQLFQDVSVPDRIEHHAVLHQPQERAEREIAAHRREVGADLVEIALDDVQGDRQARIGEIGILLVEAWRPDHLVIWLGPFLAVGVGPGKPDRRLDAPRQSRPA